MGMIQLKVDEWDDSDGPIHGFLGRRGGKSAGPFYGLNLSFCVGDDPETVKDNLCDMKRFVGIHDLRLVTMKQVHGDHIIAVTDKNVKDAGDADGMVTQETNMFLGVLTADCVPILFKARRQKVAAVVHAGWRGTLAGIGAKMVRILKTDYGVFPGDVEAAIGPAIDPCCYEIGEDVGKLLKEEWKGLAKTRSSRSPRVRFRWAWFRRACARDNSTSCRRE